MDKELAGEATASRTGTLAKQIEGAYQRIGVTGAHRQIVFMILLGVFFDALEQNAVGITGPVLRQAWGLGATEIGLLNTMTFTATALGRLATGLIVDKYGRRQMLVINLIIFAGGSLLCAVAPELPRPCGRTLRGGLRPWRRDRRGRDHDGRILRRQTPGHRRGPHQRHRRRTRQHAGAGIRHPGLHAL